MNKVTASLLLLELVISACALPSPAKRQVAEVSNDDLEKSISPSLREEYNRVNGAPKDAQASYNTIRSIPPESISIPGCEREFEFEFQVPSDVNNEWGVKTDLKVYISRTKPSPGLLYISIFGVDSNENRQFLAIKELAHESTGGELKFDISLFNDKIFRQQGQPKVRLQVEVHTVPTSQTPGLPCDKVPISLVATDMKPNLLLYTYDSRVEDIHYSTGDMDNKEKRSLPEPNPIRGTRSSNGPFCQRLEFNVPVDQIPISKSLGEGRIILPKGTYNAGVCGGSCTNNIPLLVKHSRQLHHVTTAHGFENPHANTHYTQCCAPAKYSTLSVVYATNNEFKVIMMNQMQVEACDCLQVLAYNPVPVSE